MNYLNIQLTKGNAPGAAYMALDGRYVVRRYNHQRDRAGGCKWVVSRARGGVVGRSNTLDGIRWAIFCSENPS